MRYRPLILLSFCLVGVIRDARAEADAEVGLAALQSETARWLSTTSAPEKRRLAGTYVTLDPNPNDPFAKVACDDDGDHVLVVSHAMLALISHLARAVSYDEANTSHLVDDYASFLARSQLPSRRLLPPPAGFYDRDKPEATNDDRLSEIISFVVGRELARLRAGDLSCPNPTVTKESGDDLWTNAEQRNAAEVTARIYPGPQNERDEEALTRTLESGRTDKGAFGVLRFFARFESEARAVGGRFLPEYVALHPNAAMRIEHLTKIVRER